MKKRSILKYLNLDELKLDFNNPRFGELYNGSDKEDDLVEYLLYEEAAEEIAHAIVEKDEFYEDKALWVIKDKDGKYVVRDGNRRCAAVKALQMPGKYKLSDPKTPIVELPVYEYTDEAELKARIGEEHSASLFRSWERIAKALQILDLADNKELELMNSLDPRPGDYIKLGTFYKEAVKYGGDTLRKQLRKGRGKTGGKTIIYERLFRDAKICGYQFKKAPSSRIEVIDLEKFKSYIKALVKYIDANPDLKTKDLDDDKSFIKKLKDYGFDAFAKPADTSGTNGDGKENGATGGNGTGSGNGIGTGGANDGTGNSPASGVGAAGRGSSGASGTGSTSGSGGKRGSVKKKATITRKKVPSGLIARIDEYFALDSTYSPNAKIAMARVTYECVLKYVVEHTKSGNIIFKNSGHFGPAYSKKPYTNFEELNKKFIDLITNVGKSQAFSAFEFDKMHQTIHNYNITGKTIDADQIKDNFIVLLEFMLQDEADLLNSLDLTKIK